MTTSNIALKVGLPTASNYQIDLFNAVDYAMEELLEGRIPSSIIVDAKPGSGKTTTGVAATRLIPDAFSAIFVAFSKPIADELATRLPRGIAGKTFHSHWLRQWNRHCKSKYGKWPEHNNFKINDAVDKHFGINRRSRPRNETAAQKAQRTHTEDMADNVKFLVEKAKLYGVVPVGYPNGKCIDGMADVLPFWEYLSDFFDQQIDQEELEETVEIARKILWSGLDDELIVDFTDMLYMPAVKAVKSERFMVVMVDECQDLSELQHFLLTKMLDSAGVLIAIGDRRQCQPSGTMVSIPGPNTKPIEDLQVGDKLISYASGKSSFTGTCNKGNVVVEEIGHRNYNGWMYSITAGGRTTRGTDNHRWLVKFTKEASAKYCVYLMRRGKHFRVGMSRLCYAHGFGPASRARDEKADTVYLLKVFATKAEALLEEKKITCSRKIPDVLFAYNDQTPALGMSKNDYRKFSEGFWSDWPDNISDGMECLTHYGRDIEYPIWINGDNSHIGRYSFITQSVNLIPGIMTMRTFDGTVHGGSWEPITVERNFVNEPVHSLRVTPLHDNGYRHLYVADGIVTHNSIYGFIGADIDSMDNLKDRFKCVEYPLSISYRCAQKIVDYAYTIYPEIEARPNAPEGSVEYPTKLDINDFKAGDLIICRNNAPIIGLAYRLISNRIPAKVLGRDIGKGLTKLIRRLDMDGTLPGLIENLVAWKIRQFAIAERKGSSEHTKHQIEDKFECISVLAHAAEIKNVAELLTLIDTMFTSTQEATTIISPTRVTLSTIHKIKGAEADTVIILDPHLIHAPWIKQEGWQSVQEENLRFVAVSRAKSRLIFIRSDMIVS